MQQIQLQAHINANSQETFSTNATTIGKDKELLCAVTFFSVGSGMKLLQPGKVEQTSGAGF